VASAATRAAIHFEDGDILVFAQKIVSKAEDTLVLLARVKPYPEALAIARISRCNDSFW
jgi:F420-0:gamma-glutamyl ligase